MKKLLVLALITTGISFASLNALTKKTTCKAKCLKNNFEKPGKQNMEAIYKKCCRAFERESTLDLCKRNLGRCLDACKTDFCTTSCNKAWNCTLPQIDCKKPKAKLSPISPRVPRPRSNTN